MAKYHLKGNFTNNTAVNGGAVCADVAIAISTFTIDGIFDSNDARYGGAVYSFDPSGNFTGIYKNNKAHKDGGAIYTTRSSTKYGRSYNISGEFYSNIANGQGSAICALNIEHTGRFPSNVILTYDETDFDEVCGGFPNTKSVRSNRGGARNKKGDVFGEWNKNIEMNYECGFNDSGSASRYFYCAKASKKDRDEGLEEFEEKNTMCDRNPELASANMPQNRSGNLRKNTHPTVKPTSLMQYLVRLVTPNNGIVLDPFNGSGSTGKAVMYENKERNKNYKYIGIELTEEYLPISKARIEFVCNLKEEELKEMQLSIFDI